MIIIFKIIIKWERLKIKLKFVKYVIQMQHVYVLNVIIIFVKDVIKDIKNDLKHKKENIDPFIPIDLKCPNHPQDRMNLFCINEKGKINYYYI